MSKPCPFALSQGGGCAGDCTMCKYLDDDEPEELCPYTVHECFEDCIACPIMAEDWEQRTKSILCVGEKENV